MNGTVSDSVLDSRLQEIMGCLVYVVGSQVRIIFFLKLFIQLPIIFTYFITTITFFKN